MNNNLVAGIVIVGAVFVSSFLFKPEVNVTVEQPFGAVPVLSSPTAINGVATYYEAKGLTTATTTVCAIRGPSATSTLVHAAIRLTTSTTTASVVRIARATTAYATTTNINSYSVAANAQATIVASTTGSVAGDATIFPPNNWVVFSMQGNVGTFSPVGVCQASFVAI